MTITERLTERKLSEEMLAEFERGLGARLPDDYRQFMIEHNGGRPAPSVFEFMTADGTSDCSVRVFLTLDDRENYSIQTYMSRYDDRIPLQTLPIACDSFGNLVLLDLGAKAVGTIYFWDHEKESMDDPTWDNINVAAFSFTEFINTLA